MDLTIADMSYYAPEFVIKINGRETSAEVTKYILKITIEQELNKTNNFRFDIQDEFRAGQFQWLGNDLFKYGNTVTVLLGYVYNKQHMMEGKIQNISASFSQGLAPTLSVEGSDIAYDFLMQESEPKDFKEKKDSDIVKEIAKMAHIEAVVDETEQVFPIKKKRGGINYFEFLTDITNSNRGYELNLSGRKLFFVKAKKDKKAMLKVKWGKDLISFQPTLNTAQAITGVVVRSWDRSRKKTIEATVNAGEETRQESGKKTASQITKKISGDKTKVITDRPVRSVEEAREEALSELEDASDNFIRASAEIIGTPELKPAECVDVEGLGDWFSGKYYIEKVTHSIDNNGFRTKFDARRNNV